MAANRLRRAHVTRLWNPFPATLAMGLPSLASENWPLVLADGA
jgi:hypothetical protein